MTRTEINGTTRMTLVGVRVDARVTFTFHPDACKADTEAVFQAVGRFVREWGRWLGEWSMTERETDEGEDVWVFRAEMEDVPALAFGVEVTRFLREEGNWEEGGSPDVWWFCNHLDLGGVLGDRLFDEFAEWCGFADPDRLSYRDTGFECVAEHCHVTDMRVCKPIKN